jgi:hypothetical protein
LVYKWQSIHNKENMPERNIKIANNLLTFQACAILLAIWRFYVTNILLQFKNVARWTDNDMLPFDNVIFSFIKNVLIDHIRWKLILYQYLLLSLFITVKPFYVMILLIDCRQLTIEIFPRQLPLTDTYFLLSK